MKKLSLILLVLTLCLCVAACGNNKTDDTSSVNQSSAVLSEVSESSGNTPSEESVIASGSEDTSSNAVSSNASSEAGSTVTTPSATPSAPTESTEDNPVSTFSIVIGGDESEATVEAW